MPPDRPLIMTIEKFLREMDMPATRFGRMAVHDPRFVLDLRMGREPRRDTRCRVEHFMNIYRSTGAVSAAQVPAEARQELLECARPINGVGDKAGHCGIRMGWKWQKNGLFALCTRDAGGI